MRSVRAKRATLMRLELVDRTVHLDTGRVEGPQGQSGALTTKEREALCHLVDHARRDVSHDELLAEVWGYAPGVESRAPYFTLRRLRAKLEAEPRRPRHLLTAHGVGYRFVPLPQPSISAVPPPGYASTNLTRDVGRLHGRDDSLARLRNALAEHPLVTLTGPAGAGKTRLARHLGLELVREGRRVWFVDLSDVQTVPGLVAATARLLGVPIGDPDDTLDVLTRALEAQSECLFVLDNFEQLVPLGIEVVGTWLRHGTRLLLTSRRRLRVDDEQVLELGPVSADAAVAILHDRARAAGRELPDGPPMRAALDELANTVDRLPLGLELAASRLAVLSPNQLSSRLPDALDLLSHGARDVGRHRSLRATLQSSWDLLSAEEQRVLAALSLFRGGFWLEEAEAVLTADPVQVVHIVQELVERSLIHTSTLSEVPDEVRFSLLLSVRTFAAEALETSSVAETVQVRHALAYASLGDRLRDQPEEASRLRLEADNFAAALERTTDPAVACRLALTLDRTAPGRVSTEKRRARVDQALAWARQVAEPTLLFEALAAWARAARGTPSRPDDVLAEARQLADGDPARLAEARFLEGNDHLGRGEPARAREPLAVAERLAGEVHARPLLYRILQARLHQCIDTGDFVEGPHVATQLEALRADPQLEALPFANLSVWFQRTGQHDRAVSSMEADLLLYRQRGDRHLEAHTLTNLATMAMDCADPIAASHFREAIQLCRELGNLQHEAHARYNFAVCLLDLGEDEPSARELALALATARRIGHPRYEAYLRTVLVVAALVHGDPDRAVDEGRAQLTAARQAGDRFNEAHGRLCLAAALAARGERAEAHVEFAAGEAWIRSSPFADRMATTLAQHRALVLATGTPTEQAAAAATSFDTTTAGSRVMVRARDALLERCSPTT